MSDRAQRPKIAGLNRFRKFTKLRGLRCFNAVHKMIEDGYPLAQIAEFIQVENGEYTDVNRNSLQETLRRYRDTVPLGQKVAEKHPKTYLDAARKFEKGVNILDEYEYLFRIQKSRIDRFVDSEAEDGEMLKNMSREFDTAGNLLQKIHQARMDLGLDERHIGTLTIQAEATAAAEERYGGKIAEILRDPEKRRKLVSLVEIMGTRRPEELPQGHVIETTAEDAG